MSLNHRSKFRSRTWCLLCGLLLVGACSRTTFVYNRLDFLVPWYVNDYAELNTQQDAYLDELLAPFLRWHRDHELPTYVVIIDGIQARLARPLSGADVAGIFDEFEAAWLRVERETLDWLLKLGAQLSDEQIADFMAVLWNKQAEYEEEYLGRTDAEFLEESYDDLVDSAKEYLGSLSPEQREQLRAASLRLQRADQLWLRERADWLRELETLLAREPGWQQRVVDAVAARREHLPADYVRVYQHNLGVLFDAIAELLNGRSPSQDEHLRLRLSGYRQDIETLVAQGHQTGAG